MPLFQKRVTATVRAEQFLPATAPLPFRDVGPVVCKDDQGWYVVSANGRQAITDGDWIVLEPPEANLRFGAYPIKSAIFDALYCQVGD